MADLIEPPDTMVAVETIDQDTPEPDPSEEALIRRFEEEARVPSDLRELYEEMEKDREYIHTGAFRFKDDRQFGINFILRSQYAKLAQVFPTDPGFSIRPRRPVNLHVQRRQAQEARMRAESALQEVLRQQEPSEAGGPENVDPMQAAQAAQKAEKAGERRSTAARNLRQVEEAWREDEAFSDTLEVVVERLFREAGGTMILQGAAQDAMTVGIAWLKVTWYEDRERDPLGMPIVDDPQDQMARLRRLTTEFQLGQFTETDDEFFEMMNLVEFAVTMARKMLPRGAMGLEGLANHDPSEPPSPDVLPEVDHYRGLVITPVAPENLRIDWSRVQSPEMWRAGRQITEKTWMSPDEIVERWGLSERERERLGTTMERQDSHRASSEVEEAVKGNRESTPAHEELGLDAIKKQNGEVAVWQRYDREQKRLYIWPSGLGRFVVNEIIEVSSRHFFPYIPIYYNRVTGRFLPLSDTRLVRKLQEEINQRLTDDKEARRARYPKYIAGANMLENSEKEKLMGARPHEVIEVLGDPEKIANSVHMLAGAPYDPLLYDPSLPMRLIEIQMGLPLNATGMSAQGGQRLATEVNISNDHLLAQSGRHGTMLTQALQLVGETTADYAVIGLTTETVAKIAGPTGYWPDIGREQILRGMNVDVIASGNNKAAKRQNVETWSTVSQAISMLMGAKLQAQAAGYELDVEDVARNILSEMGVRTPLGEILRRLEAAPMGGVPMQQAGAAQPDTADVGEPPAPGPGQGRAEPVASGPTSAL